MWIPALCDIPSRGNKPPKDTGAVPYSPVLPPSRQLFDHLRRPGAPKQIPVAVARYQHLPGTVRTPQLEAFPLLNDTIGNIISTAEKRIDQMRMSLKGDWRIEDLEAVASALGMKIRKSGGSHVVFP